MTAPLVFAGSGVSMPPIRLAQTAGCSCNSAISGTMHGKQELGARWAQLAEKGFETTPQHFIADEERVVVLAQDPGAGETTDAVNVFTLNADGKIVKVQGATDTAMLERVWGSK